MHSVKTRLMNQHESVGTHAGTDAKNCRKSFQATFITFCVVCRESSNLYSRQASAETLIESTLDHPRIAIHASLSANGSCLMTQMLAD